jgi:hypothetical protein
VKDNSYKLILRRLGLVLVAIGVVGCWDLVWSIADVGGKTTFELRYQLRPVLICALVAGIILLWGNLRAASIIRWLTIFSASGIACAVLLAPLYVPLGFLIAEVKHKPEVFVEPATFVLPVFLALLAIGYELGRAPVVAACEAAGVTMRSPLIPMAWSAGVAIPIIIAMSLPSNSDDAKRAKEMAFEQLGPDYSYYIESFRYVITTTTTGDKSGVTSTETKHYRGANVAAWNNNEIRLVEVRWPEE